MVVVVTVLLVYTQGGPKRRLNSCCGRETFVLCVTRRGTHVGNGELGSTMERRKQLLTAGDEPRQPACRYGSARQQGKELTHTTV